jgi:TonB-linked SusC/RagA family outer membrane protein
MKNNDFKIIHVKLKAMKLISYRIMLLATIILMSSVTKIFAITPTGTIDVAVNNNFISLSHKNSDNSDNNVTQQRLTIKGKVTDQDGEILPGVTVTVKGASQQGTITDANGEYTITNISPNATLVFSFVGMKTQEIVVGNRTTINVTLQSESIGLNEVIAVGYATQKKVNVVGSITSLSGDKIQSIPAADVTNSISGRMPGSVVIQPTGEPGQNAARILVRGRTTLGDNTGPMVVIDGVQGRSLSDVDPVDIESISVLKDASAAIYGATAANGVILVTTKNGQSGKPRLNYQFYQGYMSPTILPKVTNAGDYATMLSEYQEYEGKPRTFTDKDIELFYNGKDPWQHPNTNWIKELIASSTPVSKHNVTIDGGNANGMTYFVSFGYKAENAIYKQESTKYTQYNLRAKLDFPINSWLKTSVQYAGFIDSKLYPTKSAWDIFGQATRLLPTQWAFWPTGEPGPDIEYGDNPVVTSTFEGGYDDQKNYVNQIAFSGTITPPMIKGLSINAMFSYDINNWYRKRFCKPWTLYFPKWDTAVRNSDGYITSMELTPTLRGYDAPQLQEEYSRNLQRLINYNFNYSRTFGDHTINVFGAFEQISQNANNFAGFRKHYISDQVQTLNAGADTDKDNWGDMSIYARESWIGRFNYSFKEKYLLEAIIRRDGSLKFPPNSRWGNFPGLLLGWRASEENFWKENLSYINYFKLKASYGKIGMDPGDPFQYLNKYIKTSGLTLGTGKEVETVLSRQGVANPNITWEKQSTYNVGFESQILDNLFSLDADFFYSKRSDILAPRNASVPDFTGLTLPDENIAEVNNRGFEIVGGYHKKVNKDFHFDISANISYNHNNVVFIDEPERSVPWQRYTGHPYGATLLYKAIGIFPDQKSVDSYPHWDGAKPGDVIFEDVSGDGTITSDDKILLDKTDAPEVFYGLSFDAAYKNWSLSILIQGQGTYYRQNSADDRRGEAGNYFQWQFDNRWTPDNTNTNVARAYNRGDQYWGIGVNNSTYWYSNMAYCRLKDIVLTYNIPTNLVKKIKISNANIYFSANNPLLIYSAQRNFDPEIGNPMTYPSVKTFAIGARITF